MQLSIEFKKTAFQVAEVELIYKSRVKPSERPVIKTSKDCFEILNQIWDKQKIELREEFKVVLLNRGNQVIGIYELSTGGIAGTIADVKLILIAALKASATGIILSHNHPSGNLMQSRADEDLTKKIKDAARLLDILVLDHIILSSESYLSFSDEGLL